ncbi:helix-turn-helix domain-containing protein [Desulfovibrio sp. OttesenSCG-928-F20]|nr:helix-turn-helix domain-containing protein [Desulfovibrio sp. OttesenSCG-928-M16]MDL2290596.1 helix-turn-helix domain-containing protein [Desulfovibrio sp. OttesenSCG-928-F20]
MKKPHTDEISMTFTGPVTMIEQALEAMRSLGFEKEKQQTVNGEVAGSIPWRETNYFKEIEDKLPSVFLSGARYREGLTQAALAERSGIPRRHISEMENNKRPIGKVNARKLAKVLNIDPRRLLSV